MRVTEFLKKRAVRITLGVLLPTGAVLLAVFVKAGLRVPCVFHEVTGLYCTGCGATRAVLALLRLDIVSALGHNVLFVLFLPAAAYYLLKVYIKYVFCRDVLPFPKECTYRVGLALGIVIIAFTVLRNIPVYPFTLLAP